MIGLRKVKTYEVTWTWSEKKEKWFLHRDVKLQRQENSPAEEESKDQSTEYETNREERKYRQGR